jgi:outer membrane protein OmpA-like peptidoglycan-associated protein
VERSKQVGVGVFLIATVAGIVILLLKSCHTGPGLRDNAFAQSAAFGAGANCANSRELFVRIERAKQIKDESIGLDGATAAATLAPIEKLFHESGVTVRFFVPKEKRFSAPKTLEWSDLHKILLDTKVEAAHDREKLTGCERDVSVLVAAESTLGYGFMFDYGNSSADGIQRQGAAVFLQPIARAFPGREKEVFQRVLAHELLHVLNVHHQDWCCRPESVTYGTASSIEGGDWHLTPASAGWKTGQVTKDHIALDPFAFVMPGAGSVPFNCVTSDHRGRHERDPDPDESQVPGESSSTSGLRDCHAPVGQSAAAMPLPLPVSMNKMGVALVADAERATIHIGEPFEIRVEVTNWGKEPVLVPTNLTPESGGVVVLMQRPGSDTFTTFSPAVLVDSFEPATALRPQERSVAHITAFFGSTGWTVKSPGTYRLQLLSTARLGDRRITVASNVIELTATSTDEADCAAFQNAVQGREGALLSNELGIAMYLNGASHLVAAREFTQQLIEKNPRCSLLGGLRLAQLRAALRADPVMISTRAVVDELNQITPAAVSSQALLQTRRLGCQAALASPGSDDRDRICDPLEKVSADTPANKFDLPAGSIQGVVYFRPGSVVLGDDYLQVAKRIGEYLESDRSRRVWLKGRADSRGPDEMNLWVSNERALAMRSTLLAMGAVPQQFVITPCGEAGAVPENADDAARAGDRRVDVLTSPPLELAAYVAPAEPLAQLPTSPANCTR